ncbi:ABC transporter permease [Falsochrobactrum sp. TDYN1]|uniref:ABC transporter permease n=1 Tax=Falsochrobactrum tianjinense TaxID=2706015 RepID=A0A949PMM3_9HYPH|nr:ABC transporter permease [Falsochrobactrum sp. TDYN1]MBV2143493.1 ABC transporter permease [Falsochrobactrum sp. TDYN1]
MTDAISRQTNLPHALHKVNRFVANGGIVLVLLALSLIVTSLLEPRFLNRLNLINVMRNFSFLALPALAQMLVMTTGGFDLSVGAVVAGATLVTATIMLVVGPMFPGMEIYVTLMALLAVIALGGIVGLVNGSLVATFDISPFMVTLATTSVIMGAALYFTQGIPVYGVFDGFIKGVGRGQFLGIPIVMLIVLAVALLCVIVQRFTVYGRHIYAVGSDPRSARLSGVKVKRVVISTYALASVLAAVTGFLMTSRLGSGQAMIGGTLAMETIAAAVIGGVSLRGGVGRAELVVLAALFLTVISNAMNLVQIDSKFQTLMLGAVLIFALGMERLLQVRN